MVNFPRALQRGDKIAVTGLSSGVSTEHQARLDLVIDAVRQRGYEVVESTLLRSVDDPSFDDAALRAREFTAFYLDPSVAAVIPPWGGELAIETLPLLDFVRLAAAEPKWVCGYSDVSTVNLPLTLLSNLATVHGPSLMELAPKQKSPLVTNFFDFLTATPGATLRQQSSGKYQLRFLDYHDYFDAGFHLTETTRWRTLDDVAGDEVTLRGRLIGGCFDTLRCLAGTKFGNISAAQHAPQGEKWLLYLEVCEMAPLDMLRALHTLGFAGWFDNVAGVLFGRFPRPAAGVEVDLTHRQALQRYFAGTGIQVLHDLDIGHFPPQLVLVNGAMATLHYEDGGGYLEQTLD